MTVLPGEGLNLVILGWHGGAGQGDGREQSTFLPLPLKILGWHWPLSPASHSLLPNALICCLSRAVSLWRTVLEGLCKKLGSVHSDCGQSGGTGPQHSKGEHSYKQMAEARPSAPSRQDGTILHAPFDPTRITRLDWHLLTAPVFRYKMVTKACMVKAWWIGSGRHFRG